MKSNRDRLRHIFLPAFFVALVMTPNLTHAQCGSPATSTFPPIITSCPSADISYTAIVRDAAGVPCPGAVITMTITANCAGTLCRVPFTLTATSNAAGVLVFNPRVGGCCSGPVAFVDLAGVVVGTAQLVNSPDISADCVVNLSDIALFAGSFSSAAYARCIDLNGDGVINLSDVVIMATHIGH